MAAPSSGLSAVFLLDCDNTLLDNDALKADLDAKLHALLGDALTERFWRVYEDVRMATDTVDFPLTLESFAGEVQDADLMQRLRQTIMEYPFAERLYPDTLDTLRYMSEIGVPVIVSDGDTIYQPLKIEGSGLAAACGGRVVIYIHKEDHLEEIMARWPSDLYIMVDDKARILALTKQRDPDRFVTVHLRQGHYGVAPEQYTPPPDITLDHIGDIRGLTLADFRQHQRSRP